MGARLARVAFAVLAVAAGLEIGAEWWYQRLLAANDLRQVETQLALLGAAFLAFPVVSFVALLTLRRLPASLRVQRLATSAAVLQLAALAIQVAHRALAAHLDLFGPSMSLFHLFAYVGFATGLAADVLLSLIALRLARALGNDWLRGLAIAELVTRITVFVLGLAELSFASLGRFNQVVLWSSRVDGLLAAILCAGLAALVARLAGAEPALPSLPADDERLSPAEWSAPRNGIELYLGGALARMFFGFVSYGITASIKGSPTIETLHDVRGSILFVAVLSGAASLTMLTGLWRLSRAPAATGAGPAALLAFALAVAGLGLEFWITSITAAALNGDVGATFFAMDALPKIAAAAMLLGVGVGVSLLRALALLATALARADVAARARGTSLFLIGTGVALGLGVAMGRELFVAWALIAAGLAVAAAVQFLRVAFAVRGAITARLAA